MCRNVLINLFDVKETKARCEENLMRHPYTNAAPNLTELLGYKRQPQNMARRTNSGAILGHERLTKVRPTRVSMEVSN